MSFMKHSKKIYWTRINVYICKGSNTGHTITHRTHTHTHNVSVDSTNKQTNKRNRKKHLWIYVNLNTLSRYLYSAYTAVCVLQ